MRGIARRSRGCDTGIERMTHRRRIRRRAPPDSVHAPSRPAMEIRRRIGDVCEITRSLRPSPPGRPGRRVAPLHQLDAGDRLRPLGSDGQVADLLPAELECQLRARDVLIAVEVRRSARRSSARASSVEPSSYRMRTIIETVPSRPAGYPQAEHAAEEVDRPGRRVHRQAHRPRHHRRDPADRAVEHDRVRHLVALRVDQRERHALDDLRAPVLEDQPRGVPARTRTAGPSW